MEELVSDRSTPILMDDCDDKGNWWKFVHPKSIDSDAIRILTDSTCQPFGGDSEIGKWLHKLVKQCNVGTAIELGTYRGITTERLTQIFPQVIGMELKLSHFLYTWYTCAKCQNLKLFWGDSRNLLCPIMEEASQQDLCFSKKYLLYIDSHWSSPEIPIIGEFDALKRLKRLNPDQCAFLIDDVCVPSDCDCLHYSCIPIRSSDPNSPFLDWEFIEPLLNSFYDSPEDYKVMWNNDTRIRPFPLAGSQKLPGKLIVVPKSWGDIDIDWP